MCVEVIHWAEDAQQSSWACRDGVTGTRAVSVMSPNPPTGPTLRLADPDALFARIEQRLREARFEERECLAANPASWIAGLRITIVGGTEPIELAVDSRPSATTTCPDLQPILDWIERAERVPATPP